MTSKHNGDEYYLNCVHSFRIRNLNHKKKCEYNDSRNVAILSEDMEILDFNQNQKSYKKLFLTDADLESLIEEVDVFKNNPEKSSKANAGEHIWSCFSIAHNEDDWF